jgi:hypothetical protein
MHYARILALIDAELARLEEARHILSSLRLISEAEEPTPAILTQTSGVEKITASAALPEDDAASPLLAPVPKVVTTRSRRVARMPRIAKPMVKKTAAISLPTALGAVVSQVPVFVPAEEIRQALAQKQQAQTTEPTPSSAATSDQLTTELLARKWLHSSAQ